MKNTNKLSSRVVAAFLAMMMLVSLFPAAAFAEGEPPLPETPQEPAPIVAQEDEGQTAEDKTQPGEQPTLEPTGEPTAVPEPEETQKSEPEETKEPESGQTQEPESEQAQQPQPKPAPAYATQAELDAAFEAVGVADELEAVTAAVEAYIAVYNRLSPQDQAANAEALAYAQSYLETLRQAAAAGQTGEEFTDPEINLTYGPFNSVPVNYTVSSYSAPFYNPTTKEHSVSRVTFNPYVYRSDVGSDNASGEVYAYFKGSNESGWQLWVRLTVGNYVSDTAQNAWVYNKDMSNAYADVTFGLSFNTQNGVTVYGVSIKGAKDIQKTFTLNYNANNGSGAPAQQTKTSTASSHNFTISTQTPTRTGYTFLGWSTNRTAASASYQPGGTINVTGTTTLYAVWQKLQPDNGGGISVTKTRVSINDDASKTTAEPGDEITWSITVTNNSNVPKTVTLTEQLVGASLSANEFTLAAGASKTVTATYTVKRADEGENLINTVAASTGGTGEKENPTASDGGTHIVKSITVTWKDGYTDTPIKTETIDENADYEDLYPADPTRDGYTFDGWEDPVTDGDGNITITAKWKENLRPTTTLTVTKTADKTTVKPGDTVQYTIEVKNTGSETATDVQVQDVLDSSLTFVSATLGGKEVTPNNSSYPIGELAAGGTAKLVITATVKANVADGTVISNTASASYINNPDGKDPSSKVDVTVDENQPTPVPTPSTSPDPVDPTPTPDPADPTPTPNPADPTPTPDPADPTPTPAPADPTPTPAPADPTPTPAPADPTPTPAPGGTTDPADPDDPDDPDDPAPAPAPTAVPVAPPLVIPAPAGPVVPVAPAAPAAELPEDETPLAAPAAPAPTATPAPAGAEDLGDDEGTPLAGPGRAAWALVNLILTVLTVLASILLLIGFMGKKQKELRDDNGNLVTDAEGNPVYEWTKKRHGGVRTFSLVPAIAAVVAFILTEDMRLPMILVDRWTPLMLLIALVQLAVCFFARKSKDEMDEEDGTPGGPAPARA